jgi:hypothetical protein
LQNAWKNNLKRKIAKIFEKEKLALDSGPESSQACIGFHPL